MRSILTTALCTGFLLLAVAPAVLAHGDDMDMEMDMGAAMDVANTTAEPEKIYPPTYFAHPEHQSLILAHIVLMTLAWIFALPVAVMFSIARSRYALPVQLAFLASNGAGVLLGAVYNGKTPDLYPNNAHHKVGWIATWVVCAQVIVSLLARVAGAFKSSSNRQEHMSGERRAFIPVSSHALSEHSGHRHRGSPRFSDDSGQGTECNTASLRSNSVSTLGDDESLHHKEGYDEPENGHADDFYDEDLEDARVSSPRGGRFSALTSTIASKISSRAWRAIMIAYNIVDRSILILGFIAFALGIVTYGRFFEGHGIFSGLAHWVKGGIFFWLGIFTLGRWAGCFGEWGWAWNVRPRNASTKWRPSAEFVESFLIFFYGSTNVFMEHLGNAGKAYSAQDLEHISITILFIGGGLCGMLIESTTIRDLLNTSVAHMDSEEDNEEPPQYKFSVNPIPALVILLLGIMMSSHTQHSMISSMIHKQWGNLLTGASFARGLTYVLTYLRPPTSVLPSRPPTELLASFGLIAGGIIFMASSSDTVDGIDRKSVV